MPPWPTTEAVDLYGADADNDGAHPLEKPCAPGLHHLRRELATPPSARVAVTATLRLWDVRTVPQPEPQSGLRSLGLARFAALICRSAAEPLRDRAFPTRRRGSGGRTSGWRRSGPAPGSQLGLTWSELDLGGARPSSGRKAPCAR